MIRLANNLDLLDILKITKDAKDLFKSKGSTQWQDIDGYPNKETFLNDINNKNLYVYSINDKILGFCVISFDEDCNYDTIDGSWINLDKYAVIHRIATDKDAYNQGIASKFFKYAEELAIQNNVYNIKVDTAFENDIMLHLFSKHGYKKCGVIMLKRDTVLDKRRYAFQKILKK